MATLTQTELTCDVCGSSEGVQTQAFGLDGTTYEIDLCQKDNEDLSRIAAGYIAKARKTTASRSRRRDTGRPGSKQPRSKQPRSKQPRSKQPRSKQPRSKQPDSKQPRSKQPGTVTGPVRAKGILVYGILPEDIEVAGDMPGIGEHPGPLRIVRSAGLAALTSELEPSGRLGTADDLSAYQEILDGTATEVPVVPLCFGTVLASEDQVADELLAAHHDEFAGALEELDGRVEFVVKGRYTEPAVAPRRAEAARALEQAMQEYCVASVAREPAGERDAADVAFLVPAGQERDVERVIGKLAREWEGRIELELQGPTAAYDFVNPGKWCGRSQVG